MKHTPAPWKIVDTPSGLEIRAGGGWLFLVDDNRKSSDAGTDFLETQNANLVLMQKAPELYDILIEARVYVEKAYECAFPEYRERESLIERIDDLLRTIDEGRLETK